MGKPYDQELTSLPETYSWALSQDVDAIAKAVKASAHLPLMAVGSGGSLAAAETMVRCHQHNVGALGRAVTPLELISALPQDGRVSVWFFSAGGGNIDVRRAFEHTLLAEPKQVVAMVGRRGSQLCALKEKYNYADVFDYSLPSGNDGFLATNSLLAFSTLICRAYDEVAKPPDSVALPGSAESLYKETFPAHPLERLEEKTLPFWGKNSIHVVYSSELKAIAVDIESRFIEAGLSSVHLADFRNFAHGRHHWLDKNRDTTAVLALSSPKDTELAQATLALLPTFVPTLHIPVNATGSRAAISGLLLSMFLAGFAGRSKGIDPGRPGVPEFGGEMYNLQTPSGFTTSVETVDSAIRRKVGIAPSLLQSDRRNRWIESYNSFRASISKTEFSAIVLDYDGTVVDVRDRFAPPKLGIATEIIRLLTAGITVGFATGRGKSIRQALRSVIPPSLHHLVIIGYYNGAEVSWLTDDSAPDGDSEPCTDLKLSLQLLNDNLEITSLARIEARKYQLTVEAKDIVPENLIFDLAQDQLAGRLQSPLPDIFRSSHSIDILAQGVSKISIIKQIMENLGPDSNVLTIGDRGKWPGNDSILLKHVHSLSVDEVSPCQATCWNICPAGIRGPQGTQYYLTALEVLNTSRPVAKLALRG
jgi:hydroxymethylpyrimidine pyrophosphatase-like HAD family hydrolase